MIFKLFSEKMELRKIARIIVVELKIVQYDLKKLMEYENLYNTKPKNISYIEFHD